MSIEKPTALSLTKKGFNYTSICNQVVQSITNPDSLAIWCLLCTMPEGWIIRPTHLQSQFHFSRRRYYAAMKYLREAGLISQNKTRMSDGTLRAGELICHATPMEPELPETVNPVENVNLTGLTSYRKAGEPESRLSVTHRNKESLEIKQKEEIKHKENMSRKDPLDDSPPDTGQILHSTPDSLLAGNLPGDVNQDSGLTELFNQVQVAQPPATKQDKTQQEAIWVIDYLNAKTGKRFKHTKSNISMVAARLVDYTQQEIAQVITRKVSEWSNDSKMRQYLRPSTLFAAKNFDSYYGEINQPLPTENQNGTARRTAPASTREETIGFIRKAERAISERGVNVPF